MSHETFWSLLHDAAHWEFEIFLMVLFDGVIAGLLYPFVRKHWAHHVARDQRDQTFNWSMSPKAKKAGHSQFPPTWTASNPVMPAEYDGCHYHSSSESVGASLAGHTTCDWESSLQAARCATRERLEREYQSRAEAAAK